MGKERKQTKFRNFIEKAKKVLPDIAAVGGKLATGNYLGAISDVGEILTGKAEAEPNNEKINALLYEYELKREEFAIEEDRLILQDKANARNMYKEDNALQKVFAITFLACYIGMTILMLYGFYKVGIAEVEVANYVVAFVTSVYTGMSMKVNTIVEFLFGSSLSTKNTTNEKD
jgi:hypothetical protein